MQLYYAETMHPRKPCAVAKHLALPVAYVPVDLGQGEHKAPAHLARHPLGRVPVLVDGARTVWESVAIMVHLALRAESDLWPTRDAAQQVEVMRWLSFDAAHWAPAAGTYYFEHVIRPQLGMGPADPATLAATAPALHEAARVLDAHLADRAYLLGERLSLADFAVGALLPLADDIALPLAPHANLRRYRERLLQLDAIRDPFPPARSQSQGSYSGGRLR